MRRLETSIPYCFMISILALFWGQDSPAQTEGLQGKLADGMRQVTELTCSDSGRCVLDGVLYIIDTNIRSVDIVSAYEYTDSKSQASIHDSLFNYARKEVAIATFSGGFFGGEAFDGYTAVGGLKVDGRVVTDFMPDWKSSAVICSDENSGDLKVYGVSSLLDGVNASTKAFYVGSECLQSGPVVYSNNTSGDQLKEIVGGAFTDDFWEKKTNRNVIVSFENGQVGVLYAKSASLTEVSDALGIYSKNNQQITRAVNLNGGPWSGYIVRTKDAPIIEGKTDVGYPSAFIVK